MPHRLIPLGAALLFLFGCSDRPDLSAAISENARRAGYPQLVELTGLLPSSANEPDDIDPAAELLARVVALRSRAARLQRPVVDANSRRRMNAALVRHNS